LHRWGEIWRGGGDAKFHPHRCNDKGVGPQKLKFLLRFDQNVEYKRPAGAYALRDFHKICRVCTTFQDALDVKIWLDLLEGLWSYGGFKLRGSGSPKFSAPPSSETMRQTPKSFRGAKINELEVLYHHAKCGGARISPAAGAAKNVEFCLLPAALRAAHTCRYLVYSEADFEVFRPAGATRFTDGGEIWHGGGDLGSPPPCQISPPSVQRQGYRTPKIEIFTQI